MKPVEILLVEDNAADVILTRHAFKSCKVSNDLTVATDGEMAMKMLLQEGEYENQQRPDLVILDLNIPKIEGREVLRQMKQTDGLKDIPVVIMSGSTAEKDIQEVKELQAATYINKPINLEKMVDLAKSIEHFWLSFTTSSDQT